MGAMAWYHWSEERALALADLRDVQQPERPVVKPHGLWLSAGHAWQQACDGMHMSTRGHKHRVRLAPGANLLVVSTPEGLREVCEGEATASWPLVARRYDGVVVPDYPALCALAAGLWMSEEGGGRVDVAGRLGYTWFVVLDCSCACIWRPSRAVESIEHLPEQPPPPRALPPPLPPMWAAGDDCDDELGDDELGEPQE